MLLIIPSIDLIDGESRNSISSHFEGDTPFADISKNPLSLACLWRKENSKSLQINDLDYQYSLESTNNSNSILYLIENIDIPVILFSNIKTVEEAEFWLSNGVYRIILRELPITNPEGVKKLIQKYSPSRVIFGIVDDNFLSGPYLKRYGINNFLYCQLIKDLGANRICIGNINYHYEAEPIEYRMISDFLDKVNLNATLINLIHSGDDLKSIINLNQHKIDSVVIGKALYENFFPCQKLWRKVEMKLEG